ncbi:phosphoribosyltransferase [Gordonia sp. HNM0687]|uniref:Phosphoribosyltransferase n=1 Tax=Gordonia mangrovi TaxID=2665643 RepID=A0A6L7GX91_9ACTN|nr:phosphoribosyltransferase family protein [Gordonia mangrovi]MXP23661.1 phosphoribosyltransferase [Gordonia mangrovi]UVF79724.1 phosphoribosyltransferase family protein [Gordonia mangrovi]
MWRRSEVFANRSEAGAALGRLLSADAQLMKSADRIVVLGLARGGVPVAREVASALGARLDVLVVRKLGAPNHPEYAMGAIAAGEIVVNDDVPRRLGVSEEQFREIVEREDRIRVDRESRYRQGREPLALSGKIVALVDDGLATGSTMEVALKAVRAAGADSAIVAVPTGPRDVLDRFTDDDAVDKVFCVSTPEPFYAVGGSYDDFRQVDDDEVTRCLSSP